MPRFRAASSPVISMTSSGPLVSSASDMPSTLPGHGSTAPRVTAPSDTPRQRRKAPDPEGPRGLWQPVRPDRLAESYSAPQRFQVFTRSPRPRALDGYLRALRTNPSGGMTDCPAAAEAATTRPGRPRDWCGFWRASPPPWRSNRPRVGRAIQTRPWSLRSRAGAFRHRAM